MTIQREYTSEDIIKNYRLIAARESLGFTALKTAKQIGICRASYLSYESLRGYPKPKTQIKICGFYRSRGVPLEEEVVFPTELRDMKIKKPYVAVKEVPKGLLPSYFRMDIPSGELNQEQRVEALELTDRLEEALGLLMPREQQVLRMRYMYEGETRPTYEEIGKAIGRADGTGKVSTETVRVIEARALRKLRHPSRGKKLRDFLN